MGCTKRDLSITQAKCKLACHETSGTSREIKNSALSTKNSLHATCQNASTRPPTTSIYAVWRPSRRERSVAVATQASRMLDSHNGLFAAEFQVHTLVQVFFVIQCIWTGVMGLLVSYDPTLSPINDTGVFMRKGSREQFVHPNVRGAWSVRGGSMFLVAAGALYFGTRETYLVAMAAIIWREAYDSVEMFCCMKEWDKILLRVWWSPIGPMPPLLSFNLLNVLAVSAILRAD